MAKASTGPRVIKLYGQQQNVKQAADDFFNEYFHLEASYAISTSRAPGDENLVSLSAEDYVQLTFEDTSTWFGNRDTLAELFPEINFSSRSAAGAAELPFAVQADDASRGIATQIILKSFRKYSKKAVNAGMVKIAEALQKKALENRSGLYAVDENFEIQPFKNIDKARPVLLFLHGTASSTKGSFAALKTGSIWQEIQKIYGPNLLALNMKPLPKARCKMF